MEGFPKKSLTITEIIKAVISSYSKVFDRVWRVSMLMGLLMIGTLSTNINLEGSAALFKYLVLILQVFFMLSAVYLSSLLMHNIYDLYRNSETDIKEAVKIINERYIRIAGAVISVIVICSLGLMLFVLPGLIAIITFILVQPLVLFDEKTILESLKESAQLVWGNWWHTSAIIISSLLAYGLFSYIIKLLIPSESKTAAIIAQGFFISFYYPLFYTTVLYLFNDLKLRANEKDAAIIIT